MGGVNDFGDVELKDQGSRVVAAGTRQKERMGWKKMEAKRKHFPDVYAERRTFL